MRRKAGRKTICGRHSYSHAFRQTGVEHSAYYRAIKRSFVHGRLLERMGALDKALARLIELHWPAVLQNVAQMAEGPGREAVRATSRAASTETHSRSSISFDF